MTRALIPFRGYWGAALACATAAVLYLAVQFGHFPGVADVVPNWPSEADAVALDEATPEEELPAPRVSHVYSLYYADAGQALILFDRNLIVVHPGTALPDGSRVSDLSPDSLVTNRGRTLHIR